MLQKYKFKTKEETKKTRNHNNMYQKDASLKNAERETPEIRGNPEGQQR